MINNSPSATVPNQLMAAQNPQPAPPMSGQIQPAPPQVTQKQIDDLHNHFDDMQDEFKKLIHLPDDELNLSKIYGAASDLITKNKLSKGRRGASAMEVASELSGKDFPKKSQNGVDPTPQDLRNYLLNQFSKITKLQAAYTAKLGPPSPMASTPAQPTMQQPQPGGVSPQQPQPNVGVSS
jgi:hypothetical protein